MKAHQGEGPLPGQQPPGNAACVSPDEALCLIREHRADKAQDFEAAILQLLRAGSLLLDSGATLCTLFAKPAAGPLETYLKRYMIH